MFKINGLDSEISRKVIWWSFMACVIGVAVINLTYSEISSTEGMR